jgi:hypothetical protein
LNGRKPADVPEPSPNYARALTIFTQQQALIELTTWQILKDQGVPYAHVVNANLHLARNIAAALKLGEMHYLGSEIDWVRGLIDNYGIDAAYLQLYMDAYFLAVKQHLGREAQPIVDWLSQFQAA